jgi:flagellin
MGLSIRTNSFGLSLTANINRNMMSLLSSMAKLSSGFRINSAADDPAGLVVSEQLRSRIGSLNQEIANTSNLIRKYETASSTVAEMRSELTELRSMAVGAANAGGNDDASQAAFAMVGEHLVQQFNRTAELATYNNSNLLDGAEGSVATVTKLEGVDFSTPEAAEASLAVIDEAAAELDSVQGELGATQKNELEARHRTLENTVQNLSAAESMLRDTDYAKEYSNTVASMIRLKANVAVAAHAYVKSALVLSLFK